MLVCGRNKMWVVHFVLKGYKMCPYHFTLVTEDDTLFISLFLFLEFPG